MPHLRSVPAFVVAYAAILVVVISTSFPRQTGDAGDYLAMAHNLSHVRPPALSETNAADITRYFRRWKTGYQFVTPLLLPSRRGGDGRYDFQHFWFYSALVAPLLVVTDAAGVHPNWAFTIVNLALLLLAAAVVSRRLHWWASAVLFLGPILWWADKAQTEVFTFSLLAIAMACLRERPWWSMVCLGAASTQNPPIAAALVATGVVAAIARPAWIRTRKFWVGAGVGLALAVLYPLYYLIHLGRLTSFGGIRDQLPTYGELKVPVLDLNFGLVFNAPVLSLIIVLLFVALLRRHHRGLFDFEMTTAVIILAIFLVAFSQTPQFAAGGTPGMDRYALWLLPLAIPIFSRAQETFTISWQLAVPVVALATLWSFVYFNPRRLEGWATPTRVAAFVWRHFPSLDNPLAEIFNARIAHQEFPLIPAATSSCSKVEIVYGKWPARCPVATIPLHCTRSPCYANRSGPGYSFADAAVPKGTEASALPGPQVLLPPGITMSSRGPASSFKLAAGTIRAPAGRVLRIVPGQVLGSVDGSLVAGEVVKFEGWAGSVRDKTPATSILLFVDGRFIGEAPPTVPRPDVAQALHAPIELSGFSVQLSRQLLGHLNGSQKSAVQLFGVERQVASQLPFNCTSDLPQDFGCKPGSFKG